MTNVIVTLIDATEAPIVSGSPEDIWTLTFENESVTRRAYTVRYSDGRPDQRFRTWMPKEAMR